MPAYLHPGVYLEEIPSGAKPVDVVATSTAAFVGEASRGPLNTPTLVHSLDQYQTVFGPLASETDAFGLAAGAFYANGGKDAYFMRIADGTPGNTVAATINLDGEGATGVLTINAANEGAWGNSILLRVRKPNTTDQVFALDIGHYQKQNQINVFKVDETYAGLTMSPNDPNYVLTRVNAASQLVKVVQNDVSASVQNGTLTSGSVPTTATYFSAALPADKSLTINLNGLGAKLVKVTVAAQLKGTSNVTDGQAIAAAIQAAVNGIAPTQDPYKSFTCTYTGGTTGSGTSTGGQFVLTSTKDASSSVVVLDSGSDPTSLGKICLIDQADAQLSTGAAKVIPKAFPVGVDASPLTGGKAPSPQQSDYRTAFAKLKKVRDVSILLLPGRSMAADGTGNVAISEAVSHIMDAGNRMLIVDPPQGVELTQSSQVDALQLTTSNYAVLYYPWVKITNPFYNADTNPTAQRTLTVAPSSFAAGQWSRTDSARGVWKAPAGVEAQLNGAAGLEFQVEDGEQDQLNPVGVNCFRKLPSFGPVVWGARTLATKADPSWRYVPVRRTAIMIEQSIYNGIQWAVFEPNDYRLWASLRNNIGAFMDNLFRAGAFQGDKASDAFYVRCGLGDTMVQDDIDRGQVIVIVGFAPLKPAEFVIVRIQQKLQQ
jgi:phage tail sheath protein FI